MPKTTAPRTIRVTASAGFGSTPRVPLTGFNVIGMLTLWTYVAARLALIVRDHMRRRWQEFAPRLEAELATPERIEQWRRIGFDTRIAVPMIAACLYAVAGTVIGGFCVRWAFDPEFLDYSAILRVVGVSATVFYVATCILVVWFARRMRAHEISELAIEEGGAGAADYSEIVFDESMVARWEAINNHIALFLIISFAMIGSPIVAALLFLTGATWEYPGLPAFICLVIGGVFHYWGTRLLLGLFNSHLALETSQRNQSSSVPSDVNSARLALAPHTTEPADHPLPGVAYEPYDGMEPFIFVSYKREDFPRIKTMLGSVHDHGFRLWYDKGIPGGAEWAALIEQKLKDCSMLLFFISRGSVESRYCRREVRYIDQLGKPILCIRLEPTELAHGLEMLLTQYQIVDASNEDFTREIERALKYLRLI